MKKILLATAAALVVATSAFADGHNTVKLGVVLGYTGPIESLTPDMAAGAEDAMAEVTASGALLGGKSVESVRADSTCIDSQAAVTSAERVITSDGVSGIVGADCSGVTGSILQGPARANGIVMVSPSATSPALSTAEDDGLFFRTAPSDARQGQVIAEVLKERGINSIAISYVNNDYGKGLADSIEANAGMQGIDVTISASHEDGKGDYSAEIGALAAAGGDMLVVAGYLDQGGKGVIQSSLDAGAFDVFFLPDGMIGDALFENFGTDLNGSLGTVPGTDSNGATLFDDKAAAGGYKAGPFAAESYDAAALILLAMQAAGSTDSADYKEKLMMVANAPGEQIQPGELAKGLGILANGGDIDYVGASAVELIGPGESAGNYRIVEVVDGMDTTAKYM